MDSFKDFITETYITLKRGDPRMALHAPQVHALLKKAYEPVGGIAGNGFSSPEDMVKNIPMWKLHVRDGQVKAASLYKDKQGRKGVAGGTDGTPDGLEAMKHMNTSDIKRGVSYSEVSGPALSFVKRLMGGTIEKHAIHPDNFAAHGIRDPHFPVPHDDPEVLRHPELKHLFYQREIGGHMKTKIMLGKPGVPIT